MSATPPEPRVGTVLETRDDIDVYRIERLPDGWAIQYRTGENEYGNTHTSSRISWRSAWKARGPPTTGTPFTTVPAGAPPLPLALPDTALDLSAPDASGDSIAMPPPAKPYRKPATTTPHSTSSSGVSMSGSIGDAAAGIRGSNDIAAGAIGTLGQGISQVEEARGQLQAAVAGSPQADVGDALGLYARAIDAIQDAQKAVQAAQDAAAAVAGRL